MRFLVVFYCQYFFYIKSDSVIWSLIQLNKYIRVSIIKAVKLYIPTQPIDIELHS